MSKLMLNNDNWDKIPPELQDLSPSRQRKILAWADQQRADATFVGVMIGLKAMNQQLGIGMKRMRELLPTWQRDIENYYDDRKLRDEQLRQWLYDIGFIIRDGVIAGAVSDEGKAVRAKKAGWDIDGNGIQEGGK